jgi:small-conductance mechanosensitive channel
LFEKLNFTLNCSNIAKIPFLKKREMKTGLKIVIELILLVGAIYAKYFDDGLSAQIRDNNILDAVIFFLIYVLILRLTVSSVKLIFLGRKRIKREVGKKDNILIGVNNIYRILFAIGLIIALFGFFGIDIRTLLTSLSIVAAAFAIISKEFINDLIIGIYNSFSDDFEIGDYVKIDYQKGKILEIGLLKLKLLDDNDVVVFIPNGKAYSNEIVNYTKGNIRQMNIDFQLDIRFVKNIELLEEELKISLEGYSEYIVENSYNLKIVEVKKDYLDFKFQFQLVQMDRDLQIDIRKQTVRKVFSYITERSPL